MPVHDLQIGPSLVLIRHSLPNINPDFPASAWSLSEEGINHSKRFAIQLKNFHPVMVYHSVERKAAETAAELANQLNLPHQSWTGLHEHDRGNFGHNTQQAFERAVQLFFTQSSRLVFGLVTADEVFYRYSNVIDKINFQGNNSVEDDLFIVSHGTVMSLFTARYNNLDAFALWKQLTMPCAIVLNRADYSLVEIIKFPNGTE